MVDRRGSPDGQDFRELDRASGQKLVVGTWRQGRLLVLHRHAVLDNVCLVTNAPTSLRVRRTLGYVPGMVWLTFLLSPFIWLLVRWLVKAKIVLVLPLAEEYIHRERRLRQMRSLFALLGGVMFVAGVFQMLDARLPVGGWEMILGGMLIAIIVFVWSILAATRLRVVRYEEPYVWLKGVHSDIVDALPQWPHE